VNERDVISEHLSTKTEPKDMVKCCSIIDPAQFQETRP